MKSGNLLKIIFRYCLLPTAYCLFMISSLQAQDRFVAIEGQLKELSKTVPGLNEKVQLSVNGITIQDFIRGMAVANNLNVSVDPGLNEKIFNNFTDVPVSDVLVFLCKQYSLDITFIGSIMSIKKFAAPPAEQPKYVSRQIKISYDKTTSTISFDLNNDSLSQVTREITKATGKNIAFSPDLIGKMVNGFVQNATFGNAMDKLAFSNDLKITATDDNFFLVEKRDKEATVAGVKSGKNSYAQTPGLTVKRDDSFHVSVEATAVPISDIIAAVSREMGYDYFLFSEPKGNTTVRAAGVTYDDFLKLLLNGTEYTFKKQADRYLLGDRGLEGLRSTKLVQLQFRTVEKIVDFIPAKLKEGVDIKMFPDLNSLILSGSQPRIEEIEAFIVDVDRVVPVVTIEVLLVDVRNSKTLSTGIEAGLKKGGAVTGGTVFPGVDLSLGASSINEIIAGINGFGLVNLGNVTPNFYITLKLLETQGVLKMRSTPQLSTLNGNEAKMSIGKTEYYPETQTTIIGNVTGGSQTAVQWKSVNADMSISINPIVSGDEQITLKIDVQQSSFTERISPTAPPGTITRDFSSLIRVKNQEMIMLGGLDENSMSDTGSGVPLLSRIPVIKWFFSSRTKVKTDNKLTVFIKPTILY